MASSIWRRYPGLPYYAVAAVALLFAGKYLITSKPAQPTVQPPIVPAANPFASAVAGSGIVEPNSEEFQLSSPIGGTVAEVYVTAGQQVTPSQPLFKLDTRQTEADLAVAQAQLADALTQLQFYQNVPDPRAIAKQELAQRQNHVRTARAQVAQLQTTLARQVITAPLAAEVMKVNVRAGEFAAAGTNGLIVLGNTQPLHVRADFDENDIPRFSPSATTTAFVRGRAGTGGIPLTFVRIEPRVIPKRNLTGQPTERVDTRVMQVIFAAPTNLSSTLLVGQQVDIFVDAGTAAASPLTSTTLRISN
jgi:HlyD family secretion protein